MEPDLIDGAAVEAPFVEAMGHRYEVADKIGLGPLIKFRMLAKQGVMSDDFEALDVMTALLAQAFTEEAWGRFQEDMLVHRLDQDDIFAVVKSAIQLIAARPTMRPSVSSDGPATTTASSTGSSSFADRKRALGLVPVIEGMSELTG